VETSSASAVFPAPGAPTRYDFPRELASSIPTEPIITTVPANDGRGHGYGFDVFMSRPQAPADARVRGWASYTWGRAEREAYGRRYPFEYDRRHAFTAVTSLGLSARWELAATTRVAGVTAARSRDTISAALARSGSS